MAGRGAARHERRRREAGVPRTASMPGVETVEHRMDFENGRDANNEGAAAYAPVWPVAVEARAI